MRNLIKRIIHIFTLFIGLPLIMSCATVYVNQPDKMNLNSLKKDVSKGDLDYYRFEHDFATSFHNSIYFDKSGKLYFYYIQFAEFPHEIIFDFNKKKINDNFLSTKSYNERHKRKTLIDPLPLQNATSNEPMRFISVNPPFHFAFKHWYDRKYKGNDIHKFEIEIVKTKNLTALLSVLSKSDQDKFISYLEENNRLKTAFLDHLKESKSDLFYFIKNTDIYTFALAQHYLKRYFNTDQNAELLIQIYNKLDNSEWIALLSLAEASTITIIEKQVALYADQSQKNQILTALEDFKYQAYKNKDTISAYQDFIATFPSNRNVNNAKKRIEDLQFQPYKRKDSIDGYREFLARYPNHSYRSEALQKIKDLELEKHFGIAALKDAYNQGMEPLIILSRLKYASRKYPRFFNSRQQKLLSHIKYVNETALLKNQSTALGRVSAGGITGALGAFNKGLQKELLKDQSYRDRTSKYLGTIYKGELAIVFEDGIYTIDHPRPMIEAIFNSSPLTVDDITVLHAHPTAHGMKYSDRGEYQKIVKVPLEYRRSGQSLPIHSYITAGIQVGGAAAVEVAKVALADTDMSGWGTLIVSAETGGFFSSDLDRFTVKLTDNRTGMEKTQTIDTGFLSGYSITFDLTHPGEYQISITGYSEYNEKIYSITDTYRHPGPGTTFCRVYMKERYLRFDYND